MFYLPVSLIVIYTHTVRLFCYLILCQSFSPLTFSFHFLLSTSFTLFLSSSTFVFIVVM